ncbi:hypothetical protein ACROUV_003950 [Yersinia enterocolitica]|uniref:Uncharacterized protein n=1 Tax=Yersinia proxima TaxID=2890316 RepID=A0ABW9ESS0_9GAMM|nr:hypothetical protein [Yersinia enterocolitica]HEN3397469.1 hypothetical protein [Yersinia enterocolitica]
MAIKARKVIVVDIDKKDGGIYNREAVEFYDDLTNNNVDPITTNFTKEKITKMVNDAFDGNEQ